MSAKPSLERRHGLFEDLESSTVRTSPAVRTYRARDMRLIPNLLSAARLPLAIAFPFVVGHVAASLAVLSLAAASDMADGYLARKWHQATPIGALVDGVADKIFAVTVLVTLLASGMLSPVLALLLATREIAELPLALRILTTAKARLAELDRGANWFGKMATVLEFGTVVAIVLGVTFTAWLVAVTAGVGALAALTYWSRELRQRQDKIRA